MTFKYFKADWTTPIEEIKRQYRKLAMENHPDMGGDEETMKAINAEFDYLRKHNYNIHEGQQKGSTYTDERQEAPDDVTSNFIEIIEQLIKMDGLTIEICGSFIWCGGNTKAHKEQLKAMGFRWASRKKLWFLAPDGWKKQGREWSMDRIRDRHGSEVIRGQEPRRRKPYKAIA